MVGEVGCIEPFPGGGEFRRRVSSRWSGCFLEVIRVSEKWRESLKEIESFERHSRELEVWILLRFFWRFLLFPAGVVVVVLWWLTHLVFDE